MVEFRMDRPESVEVIMQTDGKQRGEEVITNRVTNSQIPTHVMSLAETYGKSVHLETNQSVKSVTAIAITSNLP